MRKFTFISGIILSIFFSGYANAKQGIEVIGKASVTAMPDQFSLTLSIKERGKLAAKVKQQVDHKSELIRKMFIKQGVKSSNIDSSQLRMFPIYEKPSIELHNNQIEKKVSRGEKVTFNTRSNNDELQRVKSFEVGRTLTVTFTKLSVYDKIIDNVVKLGVSHISPLNMSFSAPEKLYQQALEQAIKNAKNKAQNIAQQAGVKLGPLLSLTETGYHAPSRYRMASEASSAFTSQVTDKSISAQVVVNYQIVL